MIGALILLSVSPSAVVIDARRQTPISRYIYGVNYPDTWIYDWLKEWNAHHQPFTLAREGGNRFTAYNWETNASNAGADYFNENDDYLAVSNEPGWTVRNFLTDVQSAGAAALLTVPTLGYVAADKTTTMNGSQDVGKTPNYLDVRFRRSYPSKAAGQADHAVYQDQFVAWVERVKSPNTPVWFSLDNEPDFWSHTHPRLKLQPVTYAELISNNRDYARMIKNVAPDALVFGPANYGWQGFRKLQDAPDGNGRIFVDAYLDAMREAGSQAGKRLLDVYDFHWYPEATGDGIRIIYNSAPDKPGTVQARIQAPRSLWDPTYIEKSWIPQSLGNKPIMLLPDMAARIAKHYPGTKMAITEYDFGARNAISGALAQADALGIFGRYGLFAAAHWGLTHDDKAAFAGFSAFTDFDRKGARFGDLGLQVSGEDPAEDSVYAALDSHNPNRMTIVAINKTFAPKTFEFKLKGFRPKALRSYVVEDGVYDTPNPVTAAANPSGLTLTAPPLSIVTTEILQR